jgi:hypothetical protein
VPFYLKVYQGEEETPKLLSPSIASMTVKLLWSTEWGAPPLMLILCNAWGAHDRSLVQNCSPAHRRTGVLCDWIVVLHIFLWAFPFAGRNLSQFFLGTVLAKMNNICWFETLYCSIFCVLQTRRRWGLHTVCWLIHSRVRIRRPEVLLCVSSCLFVRHSLRQAAAWLLCLFVTVLVCNCW